MRQIFTSQRLETVEGVARLLEEAGIGTYISHPRSYRSKRRGQFSYSEPVPANQQPAPTDCATAVRNKPAKGRVIYGEDKSKGKKVDDLPINRLKSEVKKGPPLVPPLAANPDPRAREAWEAKKITDAQLHGDAPASQAPASAYPGGAVSPQGPLGSYGGYVTPGGVVVPGAVSDPRYFAPGSPSSQDSPRRARWRLASAPARCSPVSRCWRAAITGCSGP